MYILINIDFIITNINFMIMIFY